jgi:DNA-binding transcriptional regulator YhcF (GntR family)
MTDENIYQIIRIDEQSVTPKYVQLSNAILGAVERSQIGKDYPLPSINDMSFELELSRDTVEKSYRHLKQLGVIGSIPGKGYFIANTNVRKPLKIFLLFNKLSAHKKIMYDAFAARLGEDAAIDFYIYNNDFTVFKKLLQNKADGYTHHVIIPHFIEGGDHAHEVINRYASGNLLLLDKLIPGINGEYSAVYEDFGNDIYNALEQSRDRLSRYQALKIIFPEYTYHSKDILRGFHRYCDQYAFNGTVIADLEDIMIEKGDVFISLMEHDLVVLVEKVLATGLKVGQDVGVISYNESPIKKIILDGITTISTDFEKMGEMAAELILKGEKRQLKVPFTLTMRNSL